MLFWFKLASHLGMSVARAQAEISSREFTYWKVFLARHPSGDDLSRWLFATVNAMFANIHRGKDQQPFPVSDFLLEFKEPDDKPQDMKAAIEKMVAASGGITLTPQERERLSGKPLSTLWE